MPLSFIFHLQSCKLQSHYFYLPGEKWTFLHDLSSLSLTRKRSSCNYRVVGVFLYCQQQGQGLDVTTINKNWLSTKSPQMQTMKPSKGPMNGWRMGFGSLNTSSYCHWPCQKAFQTCTRSWQVCPGALGGLTGEHWWEAWQGLLGPAVLAGSGCCSFPMWGTVPLLQLCTAGCAWPRGCHQSCSDPLAWGTVCWETPCPAVPHPFCPAPGSVALCGMPSCHCSLDIYGQFTPIQRAVSVALPAQQHFLLHVQQQDFLVSSQELWNRPATSVDFTEHKNTGESLESKPKQDHAKVSNSNTWLWSI